jgi:hypothetical protein
MFLSFEVLAVILGTIRPGFNSTTMLFIVEPVTNIGCSICVSVGSVAMSLVISPLALIDVTICMD